MVQVLPSIPGFGEQLAQALGQGISTLGQGYVKRLENQATQNTYKTILDPNTSPIQKFTAFTKLPENVKKSSGPILAALLGPEAQAEAEAKLYRKPNVAQQSTSNQFTGPDMGVPAQNTVSPQQQIQQPVEQPIASPQPNQVPQVSDESKKLARDKRKAELTALLPQEAAKSPALHGEALAAKNELADIKRQEDQEIDERRYQEKKNLDLAKFEYQQERDINKDFKTHIDMIHEKGEAARTALPSLETAIIKNEAMETGPATWDALMSSLAPNNPFLGNFISSNAQVLQAQQPTLWSGFKEQMGGTLTDTKFAALMKKTADVGKSKGANRTILYMDYYKHLLNFKREEISDDIISANNDKKPKNFDQILKKKMEPLQEAIDRDLTRLINDKVPIEKSLKPKLAQNSENEKTYKSLNEIEKREGAYAVDDQTGQGYRFKNGKWVKE